MSRENLIEKLTNYQPMTTEEKESREFMISFANATEDCFDRTQLAGHFTGSSWIINQSWDKVILLNHVKLSRWLQPGGHCDGNPVILETAMKEAEEETGLKNLRLISEEIFDIDAHSVKHDENPEHIHYDVRFLFEADDTEELILEEGKAKEVKWVPLEDIQNLVNNEESIMRMLDKTLWLKQNTEVAVA